MLQQCNSVYEIGSGRNYVQMKTPASKGLQRRRWLLPGKLDRHPTDNGDNELLREMHLVGRAQKLKCKYSIYRALEMNLQNGR